MFDAFSVAIVFAFVPQGSVRFALCTLGFISQSPLATLLPTGMYFIYSVILSLAFLAMIPLFILRREKYASGFKQRLGKYPEFKDDGRDVIWLHCVSVGETNAARPLVDSLRSEFPEHRLVISTTTRTGQNLAHQIFADKADAIVYLPFDWKFSVRRALENYDPSLVLLMETEIWPRFILEAKRAGAKIAIVNGRLSKKSFARYSRVRSFIASVLANVDLALMQAEPDRDRIIRLGIDPTRVHVTGNLKFDQSVTASDTSMTDTLRSRFRITSEKPLIIAASTHETEEKHVIESLDGELGDSCRLLIAPRHPGRFNAVENLLQTYGYSYVRRSSTPSKDDETADIILLDTIGELRSVYGLATIVFVGGSLIRHGGQSILEPAAEGKAIVTGPYTANFEVVVREFLEHEAIRQTPTAPDDSQISERLYENFVELLNDSEKRSKLGRKARELMQSGRGATNRTVALLVTASLLRRN